MDSSYAEYLRRFLVAGGKNEEPSKQFGNITEIKLYLTAMYNSA